MRFTGYHVNNINKIFKLFWGVISNTNNTHMCVLA